VFRSLLDDLRRVSWMALGSSGYWTDASCWGLDEPGQADEIVAGHGQSELETELADASQHWPAEPADGLTPSERLLDALSLLLAHRVAGMPGGASVDGGAPTAEVLGDVRRHVERTHVGDKRRRVIALIGTKGNATSPRRMVHDHRFGRLALGGAGRLDHHRRHHEPSTVFHQRMAHEAELGFLATSLAIERRLRIRARDMRGVAGLLAVESRSPLRPGPGGSPEPSFALKLFIEAQATICVPSTDDRFHESGCVWRVRTDGTGRIVVDSSFVIDATRSGIMAGWRQAVELAMTDEEIAQLTSVSHSRTERASRVERARMLLAYRESPSFFAVARRLAAHHQTVQRCVERALAYGPLAALDDRPRPGKEPTIMPEAKAWLVSLACDKAKDHGYPHELWTTRLLARHAREHGPAAGHECLADLVQGTVCKILGQEETLAAARSRCEPYEPGNAGSACGHRRSAE
jgi:transposase